MLSMRRDTMVSCCAVAIAALTVGPFHGAAAAQSLFADVKAHQVGDVITVLIDESTTASNAAETTTDKSNKLSVENKGSGELTRFLPLKGFTSIGSQTGNSYQGNGTTRRSGSLVARMSVTVKEVQANGDLAIEGTRSLQINGETETITLSGTVKQSDVSPANTALSYKLSNINVIYKGKGNVTMGNRPGIFTRIFNFVL